MKILKKMTNGIVVILIALLHTQCALSPDMFGKKFLEFSKTYFFKIIDVPDDFKQGIDFVDFSAFWFFYFGILLIPIGLIIHHIEREKRVLPLSFTISYLTVVLVGSYMIPESGMTYFALPHALFMLIQNIVKMRKLQSVIN